MGGKGRVALQLIKVGLCVVATGLEGFEAATTGILPIATNCKLNWSMNMNIRVAV